MSQCPMCNAELNEGAKFCEKCGTPVAQAPVVETPVVEAPVVEAPVVETPVVEAPVVEAPVVETPVVETPFMETPEEPTPKKKKRPLVPILLGVIGVALIAALIFVLPMFFKSENNCVLYIKDKELFFNGLKGDASWQVTSKLFGDNEVENSRLSYMNEWNIAAYLSEDGKYLFFPDKLGAEIPDYSLSGSSLYSLYYKSVSDPDADAVKIDSDINGYYYVSADASLVTYRKGEDGDLYQYNMKKDEKEKIASEVLGCFASKDGSRIFYMTKERSFYIKEAGKDKEKLASEIDGIVRFDKDLKTFYYLKEGTLYKQEVGEDKVKIAEDVNNVIYVYEDGQIYYTTKDEDAEPASLMDYVIDDMKDADAAMQMPSRWDYATYAEYEQAYEKYSAKQFRDAMRESLKEATATLSVSTLCYFDGKEEIVITENYFGLNAYAKDVPVLSYEVSDIKKVKLSEVVSSYQAGETDSKVFDKVFTDYVAVEEEATALEAEKEIWRMQITSDGSTIYYLDNVDDEKKVGELYTVAVKDGKVGTPELYDDDVYIGPWNGAPTLVDDTQLYYYKDYNSEGVGDLYVNKEKIDSDVWTYGTKEGSVYYITDWDKEKQQGTLKHWDDGAKTKIADDVHTFQLTPDGRALYLQEYSLKNYKGELYVWEKGESTKLDDDVVCIIPTIQLIYDQFFEELM